MMEDNNQMGIRKIPRTSGAVSGPYSKLNGKKGNIRTIALTSVFLGLGGAIFGVPMYQNHSDNVALESNLGRTEDVRIARGSNLEFYARQLRSEYPEVLGDISTNKIVDYIAEINGIENPGIIFAGNRLRLPVYSNGVGNEQD